MRLMIKRGTFEVVLREERLTSPGPILRGRMVLAIKDPNTKNEVFNLNTAYNKPTFETFIEGRFVVRGFSDPLKGVKVHNTVNATQESLRLVLAMGALMGFDVWSLDVRQAFLQSAVDDKTMRQVYLEGPPATGTWQVGLLKPLYGSTDSGDLWNHSMA